MKTMMKMVVAMVAVALLSIGNTAMAQSNRGGQVLNTKNHVKESKVVHDTHKHAHHVSPIVVKKSRVNHVAVVPAPVCVATTHAVAPSNHAPAIGTVVELLPADAVSVNVGGVQVYVSLGVHYQPVVVGGRRMFRVVR